MREAILYKGNEKDIFLFYLTVILFGLYLTLPIPAFGAADQSGKCEVTEKLTVLQNINITKIDTDGKSGKIHYTATNGDKGALNLKKASDGNMLPILTLANKSPVALKEMNGAQIRMIETSKRDCSFSHPVIGDKHLSDQWILQVQLVK